MPPRLPNLFRTDPSNASRYYQMFLAQLQMEERYEEIITMCRRIRRLATPGYDRRNLQVYFLMEIDALCELARFDNAWRQLRAAERLRWDRSLDLQAHQWRVDHIPVLTMYYAPLLYFRHRDDLGRHLLEQAIALLLDSGSSFDALQCVASGKKGPPRLRYQVRLHHFYERLGLNLQQWRDWPRLVSGLHPTLFKMADISRSELRENPALLRRFVAELFKERNSRGGVVSRGERNLVESPTQVRAAQAESAREMQLFHKRTAEQRKVTQDAMKQHFGRFFQP